MTRRDSIIIKHATLARLIFLAYESDSHLAEAAYNEIERRSGR